MPKLYISDLDGTLLRSDGTLSDFSRSHLTRLLDEGLLFTVASARGVVSMQEVLPGLALRLPVIEVNGALISDLETGRHQIIHSLPNDALRDLYAFVRERGHVPFIVSVDGQHDRLYYSQLHNEGMREFVALKKALGDKRLRSANDLTDCFNQKVVAVAVVDRRPALEELGSAVGARFSAELATHFFEDGYAPGWFWLTMQDRRATKDQAVRALAEMVGLGHSDLVVFGDHWNDIEMFKLAHTAIAVENAVEELKKHATVVIGPNEDDSVVRYILEDWQ